MMDGIAIGFSVNLTLHERRLPPGTPDLLWFPGAFRRFFVLVSAFFGVML